MKKVALVTYRDLAISEDDKLLLPELDKLGISGEAVRWDKRIDWKQFDAIILRTCWDYHVRLEEFLKWIDSISRLNLWNRAEIIKWNANKKYLKDLENLGISIVPSIWIKDSSDIRAVMKAQSWEEVVIKPTVGASAYRVKRVNRESSLKDLKGEVIVQPFLKEVQEVGEWSFIFINEFYSHGILKRPKDGDFRVQGHFGGRSSSVEPGSELVEQAEEVLKKVGKKLLYARIDGFNVNGQFLVSELELIEPALFLSSHPDSVTNLAQAIKEVL